MQCLQQVEVLVGIYIASYDSWWRGRIFPGTGRGGCNLLWVLLSLWGWPLGLPKFKKTGAIWPLASPLSASKLVHQISGLVDEMTWWLKKCERSGENDQASCVSCQKNTSPHLVRLRLLRSATTGPATVSVYAVEQYVRPWECPVLHQLIDTPSKCLFLPVWDVKNALWKVLHCTCHGLGDGPVKDYQIVQCIYSLLWPSWSLALPLVQMQGFKLSPWRPVLWWGI